APARTRSKASRICSTCRSPAKASAGPRSRGSRRSRWRRCGPRRFEMATCRSFPRKREPSLLRTRAGSALARGRAGILLAALLVFVNSARAADPTPEQVDQGREVYDDNCAMCHGRDMVNTGGFAFDLRKFPKDDSDRFRNSVLNGKNQGMPAWRDK